MAVFHWIGEHSTKLAAAVQTFLFMGSLLHWWVLTADQLVAVMAFVTAILYVFVESNTVSKARVGERITQEVDRQMGTGDGSPAR